MKIIFFTFLAASYCNVHISAVRSDHPTQCDPLTFSGVSTATWGCIKDRMTEKGFSVPTGSEGEISSNYATADFNLNSSDRTLTIRIKSHSYSCQEVTDAITEIVDACRDFEKVHLVPGQTAGKLWRIDAPTVKQRETPYPQITFKRGDTIKVKAGGCVQHGGPGKTWALYVDPLKQNPTPDFYGLIKLPGMLSLMKLKELLGSGGSYQIPNDASGDMFLKLGFSDFRYTDNGYWGRKGDDGYNNQCKDQPNAWLEIEIVPRLVPK